MPQITTWYRRLYFPSEGRCVENFFALKVRGLRPGLNSRTRVPEASMLTPRPPKPPAVFVKKKHRWKVIHWSYGVRSWQSSRRMNKRNRVAVKHFTFGGAKKICDFVEDFKITNTDYYNEVRHRDGFSWNLIFGYFFKTCRENSCFIKIGYK